MQKLLIKMTNERFAFSKKKIKPYFNIFRNIDENNYEIYFDKAGKYETEEFVFHVFDPVEIKAERIVNKGVKIYCENLFYVPSVKGYYKDNEVFKSYSLTGKNEYVINCTKVDRIELNYKNNIFVKEVS